MPESCHITNTEAYKETVFEASCHLLHQLLDELSDIGKSEDGGNTRVLYSSSWLLAQQHLQCFMQEKGLITSFDQSGNLYGLLEGTDDSALSQPIFTGSHIDTVISGGKFDGALGVVAGTVALMYLKEVYGQPARSLAAVSLSEEEGSRFPFAFWGSRSITGASDWSSVRNLKDAEGITLLQAAEMCGFGPDSPFPVRPFKPHGYVELHIEQGAVLERKGTSIGVVTDIVGQKRLDVTITGEANHAGTTPMAYRKDALIGTSEIILQIHQLALSYGDPLVATVGSLDVLPGAVNVVPGKVVFTLDIRHTDKSVMDRFTSEVRSLVTESATRNGLTAEWEEHLSVDPIPMDGEWEESIQDVCDKLDISYLRMPSGAGHDAQIFAEICKVAMIFVPSQNGVSHNPMEFTSKEEINLGFRVLVELLHQYGYRGKTDE
ncbi:M20 family metallo-hydrolase [Paenibacillus sp. Marseille-Q4541]|uniref:M20 family metallo-hydrolase n=1 Tax=Paenibacillus sp. Marseille-Q4541 TaxID=2831522 RepID=UPI001BA485B2|nr:M20 family metallo-hydrolase [Paenibacillus sp. Marseille-Q4541]